MTILSRKWFYQAEVSHVLLQEVLLDLVSKKKKNDQVIEVVRAFVGTLSGLICATRKVTVESVL